MPPFRRLNKCVCVCVFMHQRVVFTAILIYKMLSLEIEFCQCLFWWLCLIKCFIFLCIVMHYLKKTVWTLRLPQKITFSDIDVALPQFTWNWINPIYIYFLFMHVNSCNTVFSSLNVIRLHDLFERNKPTFLNVASNIFHSCLDVALFTKSLMSRPVIVCLPTKRNNISLFIHLWHTPSVPTHFPGCSWRMLPSAISEPQNSVSDRTGGAWVWQLAWESHPS